VKWKAQQQPEQISVQIDFDLLLPYSDCVSHRVCLQMSNYENVVRFYPSTQNWDNLKIPIYHFAIRHDTLEETQKHHAVLLQAFAEGIDLNDDSSMKRLFGKNLMKGSNDEVQNGI
jgi:hypothetical protein